MNKTAVFDFDGVIHPYKDGYEGGFTHPCDQKVKKTIIELTEMGWDCVCCTSRALTAQGKDDVETYLASEGLLGYITKVTAEKVPARVYVDDRAVHYDGRNPHLLRDILAFQSHTEK